MDDLFYFRVQELSPISFHPVQSRPLLLTLREKALKQLCAQSQSNESLLISRQCFCLYFAAHQKQTTTAFILTQKLMVNRSGQLLIVLSPSTHSLVNLHNRTNVDLYIWPRVSTNFILEAYVKNVNQLNEKKLWEKRKFRAHIEKTKRTIDLSKSHAYMHFVPAQSVFKFALDFIGTNQFPVENLNEQVFFMFGVDGGSGSDTAAASARLSLSQNLCKIFESQFEIRFDRVEIAKLFYLTGFLNII